jgi:hypothetical protein
MESAIDDGELETTLFSEDMVMSVPGIQGWCMNDLECQVNEIFEEKSSHVFLFL